MTAQAPQVIAQQSATRYLVQVDDGKPRGWQFAKARILDTSIPSGPLRLSEPLLVESALAHGYWREPDRNAPQGAQLVALIGSLGPQE